MPTYVYETIPEDGEEPFRFELEQKMSEPALEVDPITNLKVRRVLSAPSIIGKHGPSMSGPSSDERAQKNGFAKYVNEGNGKFRKAYGPGPEIVNRDSKT